MSDFLKLADLTMNIYWKADILTHTRTNSYFTENS